MNEPSATPQPSARLFYLDALRVIAILIVFLFHAVHAYDQWDWHIKNIEQSLTLTILITILALWGMPFFFLIAGAGSWFALRRRSAKQYAIERTKRLLVPFLFFTILSFFILTDFEWGDRVYRGLVTLSFPEYLMATRDWYLTLGFSPKWLTLGGHLWFLGFLYFYAILALPVFIWLKSAAGLRFTNWLARICSLRRLADIFNPAAAAALLADPSGAYLCDTGRAPEHCALYEGYYRAQGLFGIPRKGEVDYSVDLELDLGTVVPSVAGPKRPQDRIELPKLRQEFESAFVRPVAEGGFGKSAGDLAK